MEKTHRNIKSKARVRKEKRSYRLFPYHEIAEMWKKQMSIGQIARSINRVDKNNPKDPFHSMRNCLRRMHAGYRDANGRIVRLPYRVSPNTVRISRKVGLQGA